MQTAILSPIIGGCVAAVSSKNAVLESHSLADDAKLVRVLPCDNAGANYNLQHRSSTGWQCYAWQKPAQQPYQKLHLVWRIGVLQCATLLV
jgi:hypothetical protein